MEGSGWMPGAIGHLTDGKPEENKCDGRWKRLACCRGGNCGVSIDETRQATKLNIKYRALK